MAQAKLALPRVNDALLQEIVARIVRVAQPDKIILFGSRARGDARQDSDIDLLVIAPSSKARYRRAVPLYGALSDIIISMDIMVYSPEEVEEWSEVQQAFVTTAVREGQVIY